MEKTIITMLVKKGDKVEGQRGTSVSELNDDGLDLLSRVIIRIDKVRRTAQNPRCESKYQFSDWKDVIESVNNRSDVLGDKKRILNQWDDPQYLVLIKSK